MSNAETTRIAHYTYSNVLHRASHTLRPISRHLRGKVSERASGRATKGKVNFLEKTHQTFLSPNLTSETWRHLLERESHSLFCFIVILIPASLFFFPISSHRFRFRGREKIWCTRASRASWTSRKIKRNCSFLAVFFCVRRTISVFMGSQDTDRVELLTLKIFCNIFFLSHL